MPLCACCHVCTIWKHRQTDRLKAMWLQLLTTSSVANVHLYIIAYRFTIQTCYLHLKHDKTDGQTKFDNYVVKMYIITGILTANVRDSTRQLWADGELAMATQCNACICWHRGGHSSSSSGWSALDLYWRFHCRVQIQGLQCSSPLLLLLLWPPLNVFIFGGMRATSCWNEWL